MSLNYGKRKLASVSEILIAISSSVVASILLILFSGIGLQLTLIIGLNIALMLLLTFALRSINQLSYFVITSNKLEKLETPKEMQISQILYALRLYGLVNSFEEESSILNILSTGQYMRMQNYLEILEKGLIKADTSFYLLNDHPFPPCQKILMANIKPTVNYITVTAVPDNFYTEETIIRRIEFLEQTNSAPYYLLPSQDIHLTLLIFDESVVLAYAKPNNCRVCNVSEALLFTSPDAVALFTKTFRRTVALSKKYHKSVKQNTLEILRNFQDYHITMLGRPTMLAKNHGVGSDTEQSLPDNVRTPNSTPG